MLPKLHIKLERWKYNKTFEVYVSNMGHVRNKSKAVLAPKINPNGYVTIFVGGSEPKFMLLHRLVMLTWRPTPEAEQLTVDHLDHNKRNNAVENLEWVTREENWRRACNDLESSSKAAPAPAPTKEPIEVIGVSVKDEDGKEMMYFSYLPDNYVKDELAELKIRPGFNYDFFKSCCASILSQRITYKQIKKHCGLQLQAIVRKKEKQ